ncbi:hypothetical protein BKA56DRAFT_616690 [Ilyonectria sp. MPI-CAGE-AT-0026]|nr:hypothetical protein BKA56DRAFT_616690 [Ilyonectria sp. MPI-CAGE-AT-0026]
MTEHQPLATVLPPSCHRPATVLPSTHHPMNQSVIGQVLVSDGSLEPAYLSRTPRKGAQPSFWTTTRTLDRGASTMLTRDSFIGLDTYLCACVEGMGARMTKKYTYQRRLGTEVAQAHLEGPDGRDGSELCEMGSAQLGNGSGAVVERLGGSEGAGPEGLETLSGVSLGDSSRAPPTHWMAYYIGAGGGGGGGGGDGASAAAGVVVVVDERKESRKEKDAMPHVYLLARWVLLPSCRDSGNQREKLRKAPWQRA